MAAREAKTVLAVDLGAESGRVMAVAYDGASLQVEELHRFPNTPVAVGGTLYWDFLRLWHEVQTVLARGISRLPALLRVDSLRVYFGLLDRQGLLHGYPVPYLDRRTDGMLEAAFERVPRREIFNHTGIQFMQINTLYQLYSMIQSQSPQLEMAETLLTAPDLLNYWLTGERVSEFTIASTTQMVDPRRRAWAKELVERMGIPTRSLPEIVPPGTRLGEYEGISVIAPACHDTGSAVAAVPASSGSDTFAYISSGTWSLVGLEVDESVIDDARLQANLTNEGGVNGTTRLLKNDSVLWILQQCRQTWAAGGHECNYAQLMQLARQAPPLRSL